MRRPRRWLLLCLTTVLWSSGCSEDIEGDQPGECSDGADNDRDGVFDCKDPDCAAAPACESAGGDAGVDSGPDSGGGGGHSTWKQVTAGGVHSCGIQSDDQLSCWGSDAHGQANPPGDSFAAVRASFFHSCARGTDGYLRCWGCKGDYDYGQCEVPSVDSIAHFATGTYNTCATDEAGATQCWGCVGTDQGQCQPPDQLFEGLTAGSVHGCGLVAGTAICWGNNSYGQIAAPAGVFTQLSAGTWHTCGIEDDQTTSCWGCNSSSPDNPADFGQCDAPAGSFQQVAAGVYHSCGLTTDGAIVCWGCSGQHDGNVTDTGQCTPPEGTFVSLDVGKYHGCALASDGTVTCWGDDYYGQLEVP